jgi:hypothetical protein
MLPDGGVLNVGPLPVPGQAVPVRMPSPGSEGGAFGFRPPARDGHLPGVRPLPITGRGLGDRGSPAGGVCVTRVRDPDLRVRRGRGLVSGLPPSLPYVRDPGGRPRTFPPGAVAVALELRELLPSWSFREIAEALGVPPGTLRCRVSETMRQALHKTPALCAEGLQPWVGVTEREVGAPVGHPRLRGRRPGNVAPGLRGALAVASTAPSLTPRPSPAPVTPEGAP